VAAWVAEAEEAVWKSPQDVRARYPTVSFIRGNRAVFNLKGTKYRLDTTIAFNTGIVVVERMGHTRSTRSGSFEMTAKILKTTAEYEAALHEARRLAALDPAPGTREADDLEVLALLVSDYEAKNFPLRYPNPSRQFASGWSRWARSARLGALHRQQE